jgi:hypothetical protein
VKQEIKELIHTIIGCMIELKAFREIREGIVRDYERFSKERNEKEYDVTMKIARLECDLANAKHRLRELGVY